MKTATSCLTSALLLCTTLAFAEAPRGEVVIRTRDGAARQGRIVSETDRGYLLVGSSGSVVVEYANIVDLQVLETAAPPPPPVAPPVLDNAPPMVPAPPQYQPRYQAAPQYQTPPQYQAAPQYQAPVQYQPQYQPQPAAPQTPPQPAPAVSAAALADKDKKGMRFGLGLGGLGLTVNGDSSVTAGVFARLDWTSGALTLQVSPGVLFYQTLNTYLIVGADTSMHWNLASWFAVGAGLHAGFSLSNYSCFFTAISLSPLIFKFGSESSHQVALWVSIPVLRVGEISRYFGNPMGTLSYSYLF